MFRYAEANRNHRIHGGLLRFFVHDPSRVHTMAKPIAVRTLETTDTRLKCLQALERKVLWLATWTIHNANILRPKVDGLKVGGHQASSASMVTLMTALY